MSDHPFSKPPPLGLRDYVPAADSMCIIRYAYSLDTWNILVVDGLIVLVLLPFSRGMVRDTPSRHALGYDPQSSKKDPDVVSCQKKYSLQSEL